ncbi:MAG: hypothetical protein M0Z81_11815 [Deltaproteobacteria bacterium]|jgi:hypothetical protein|nr:hypothetical protein [Deltaproteobacteria bacterium]
MNDNRYIAEKQGLPVLKGDEQKAHIRRALTSLHRAGGVFEIRALGPSKTKSNLWEGPAFGRKPIISGYFNDPAKAAEAAAGLDAIGCAGIYVTLNPVNQALLARANNRLKVAPEGGTTSDADILLLCWLLIDIDVKRPAGISSTEEEHRAALDRALWLKGTLSSKGWPEPLCGDSGNGAHLLYRLPDLANTEENKNVLKDTLNALGDLYDTKAGSDGTIRLDIDRTVFNPARITKLYGTHARKGDHTPERPHRQAQIIGGTGDE